MGAVERFAFIHDEQLRKEIDMNYLFVAYLKREYDRLPIGSMDEYNQAVTFGHKKTLLILIASIIEALLLYTIKVLEVKHKKSLGTQKELFQTLGTLSTGEKLTLYKETKVAYRDDTKFSDSIAILCDEFTEYFDTTTREKLTKMKILRNGVHIHGKLSQNIDYIDTDIESLLSDAKILTNICTAMLQQ